MSTYFQNALAVVSPGKVGLLAIHSLTYGIPVITHSSFDSQMPECEALQENLTGYFFTRNSVDELVVKMTEIMSFSAAKLNSISNIAMKKIDSEYTPSAQCDMIEAALSSIV